MKKKVILNRDLFERPHDVETGTPTKLVVKKLQARRLEMEDLHFHHDSAVLLADHRAESSAPDGERVTALTVIRTCYVHAEANPAQKLLVAGHTDTTGQPDYNLALSVLRARAVLAVLVGDRGAWAEICVKKSRVEDYQAILRWACDPIGWDCDPGGVDGKHGGKTTAAVRGFKKRYNVEFGARLPIVGSVGPETWKAFFDVYMLGLKSLMKTDDPGLDAARSRLKFVDDGMKCVGCGESHPIEAAAKDDFRSETNRRVELLFFEPSDVPTLPCHESETACKPHLCELYRLGFFDVQPVKPALEGEAIMRLVQLGTKEPAAGVTAIVEMPDGSVVEKVADGDGLVRLKGLMGQRFKLIGVRDDKDKQTLASIEKPVAIA